MTINYFPSLGNIPLTFGFRNISNFREIIFNSHLNVSNYLHITTQCYSSQCYQLQFTIIVETLNWQQSRRSKQIHVTTYQFEISRANKCLQYFENSMTVTSLQYIAKLNTMFT